MARRTSDFPNLPRQAQELAKIFLSSSREAIAASVAEFEKRHPNCGPGFQQQSEMSLRLAQLMGQLYAAELAAYSRRWDPYHPSGETETRR